MEAQTDIPSQADVQATFCATLVDEWVRSGVTNAVVCPGSRSTPLVLALADDTRLRIHVRLDERSAAFFALGLALSTSRAVVICTTSGTAAAELHAGVVEAFHSGVPLIICTADRPPRLHDFGANQTIDQRSLYGGALRWSADPGLARWEERYAWRSLGARVAAEAAHGPRGPGPVHLNLPFDEPLVGSALDLPEGRDNGAPWHTVLADTVLADTVLAHAPLAHATTSVVSVTSAAELPPGAEQLVGKRVLVIAGKGCGPSDAVLAAAEALGAPVLADPLSGLRCRRVGTVGAADSILRSDFAASALRPEVVLRGGKAHVSKVLAERLRQWADLGTKEVLVDGRWEWTDPDRQSSHLIRADPAEWWSLLATHLERSPVGEQDRAFVGLWGAAEAAAQGSIDEWCAGHPETTEPGVARATLHVAASMAATVVVASSMPIRDLEWYGAVTEDAPRVLANRGVNGIDGVVSTAMGVAAASALVETATAAPGSTAAPFPVDRPVLALVGDLAFLHDLTAFVGDGANSGLTVVVVDNGGGGIFSFLPQRSSLPEDKFEKLFGSPQKQNVADVARGLGLRVVEVSTITELDRELRAACEQGSADGTTTAVRVVVPDRDANLRHHQEIHAAVAKNVEAALVRVT